MSKPKQNQTYVVRAAITTYLTTTIEASTEEESDWEIQSVVEKED